MQSPPCGGTVGADCTANRLLADSMKSWTPTSRTEPGAGRPTMVVLPSSHPASKEVGGGGGPAHKGDQEG